MATVTFLFADIERSTELARELHERYVQLLDDVLGELRAAVAAHGGREVDTQGDGMFAAFESAGAAALAAADAQRALLDSRARVRIGLHTAEPLSWAEGYAGVGVHRAARVCSVGHGGQILLSRSTAGLVDDAELAGVSLRDLGAHHLKGMQSPERIFQLLADDLPREFPPLATFEATSDATETATVIAVDAVGVTQKVGAMPVDHFRAIIADTNRLIQETFDETGARGAVLFGDSAVAAYRSAAAALEAGRRLRAAFAEHTWPGGLKITVEIALNTGEVVATAHGYFGVAVNTAFAMLKQARGAAGAILVSSSTKGLLDLDEQLRELNGTAGVFELVR